MHRRDRNYSTLIVLISFVRISRLMASMKSERDFCPSSPLKRLRTDTRPSSSSFCPTTSMYGSFARRASLILYPIFSARSQLPECRLT